MKKCKLKILLFIQMFVISAVTCMSFSSTSDQRLFWNDIFINSPISTSEIPHISWEGNGTVICNANDLQQFPQICSDGAGGIIIAWRDQRTGVFDIYAQRIDSDGNSLWGDNGTVICNASGFQYEVQICTDGSGGAIITWNDMRPGSNSYDIYAQKVDSDGNSLWEDNGTLICNVPGAEENIQICSDGNGGAIIAWSDKRTGVDIYAQQIDSGGNLLWGGNGTVIANTTTNENKPQMCQDGAGGAIITWYIDFGSGGDIYAQRIDSGGNTLWGGNGTAVCMIDGNQRNPKICYDGSGGAIITWEDYRDVLGDEAIYAQRIDSDGNPLWLEGGTMICEGVNVINPNICSDENEGAIIVWEDYRSGVSDWDIYAQRVNPSGVTQWNVNGIPVCTADNNQDTLEIISDGGGGAIICWEDERKVGNDDIYAQWINLDGHAKWEVSGVPVCKEIDDQTGAQLCSDGAGGVFITWEDSRGVDEDIYAQYIKNFPPTSNHPGPIQTSTIGSETIDWTLYDDFGPGKYRVWTNDSNDNYYIWVDWTPWINNTKFKVQINRSASGIYNYTIEYYDIQNVLGNPDTVIVNITGWQDQRPTSNHPKNMITPGSGSETIQWTLYDDIAASYYRVWVNDTNGNPYIWQDWATWTNGIPFNVPINYTLGVYGVFNYSIEYNDSKNQFGVPDTVMVTIIDSMPTCNHPGDVTTTLYGSESIEWMLYDEYGPGSYRIWSNNTLYQDWTPWTNGTPIIVAIKRSGTGIFNYTIEFNSSTGQIAIDTVFVVITTSKPTESPILLGPQGGGGAVDFLSSPLGLGIIIGIIAVFSIMIALLIKTNNKVKDLDEKISKTKGLKTDSKKLKGGTEV